MTNNSKKISSLKELQNTVFFIFNLHKINILAKKCVKKELSIRKKFGLMQKQNSQFYK